jgi:hypothetical protein
VDLKTLRHAVDPTISDPSDYTLLFSPPISNSPDNVASMPESSTWAMMLIGFAGLGFASYRASQRQAVADLRA